LRRRRRSTLVPYTTLFRSRVDQWPIEIVDPQPNGVFGADDEFVAARFRSQDRTTPADRKLRAIQFRGVRACGAEVEGDGRIQSLDRKSTRLNSSHLVSSYA